MYPKVVRARGLLYYPVRRAASSAIQAAMGYDFVDHTLVSVHYPTFHRFTVYRNTFDRLRSLYYTFVNPAPLGEVSFGLQFDKTPSFARWIEAVCNTQDKTCDEHLQSQDWERIVPGIVIYQFPHLPTIGDEIGITIPPFGQSFANASRHLEYSTAMCKLLMLRYGNEITKWNYEPHQPVRALVLDNQPAF